MLSRLLTLIAMACAVACDPDDAADAEFRDLPAAKMVLDADGKAAQDMLAKCLPQTPPASITFETWPSDDFRPLRFTVDATTHDSVHKCFRDEMFKRGAVVVP